MTPSSLLVASQCRPPPREIVALRLYLPDSGAPAGAVGKVREPDSGGGDGFWVDLLDTIGGLGERIRKIVSRTLRAEAPAQSCHRAATRYPSCIPVSIESGKKRFAAKAMDLSSGGVFVRCDERLDVGAVVAMKLLLPAYDDAVVASAKIIHVSEGGPLHAPWSEPGIGFQFIDGDDAFRTRIDRHLELMSNAAPRHKPELG
jgi:Tfp pilus assembly protein PilZ